MKARPDATLKIDDKQELLVAKQGRRSAVARIADGLAGHLADSLRRSGGLHWGGLRWGDVSVLAPASGGIIEVTVGGKGGVVVSLNKAEALALADRIDPPTENPDEPYIRFRETNNWEMERWCFYIPLRGNEEAVRIFATAARAMEPQGGCFLGEHLPYDIRMIPITEVEVDRLCRRGRCRYMATHNKLEGRFDLRRVKAAARKMGKDGDMLYKGGVRNLMEPWGRRRSVKTNWPTGQHVTAVKRLKLEDLHRETAGRLLKAAGRDAPTGFGLSSRQRMPYNERCWEAVQRLKQAGLRIIGDVAWMTRKELLTVPGVGRETVNLAEWMLRDLGLGLVKR